jgi:hypothetical protein
LRFNSAAVRTDSAPLTLAVLTVSAANMSSMRFL